MLKRTLHSKINLFLTLLLVFCLPLFVKQVPIIIALLFLNYLLEGRFRVKFSSLFAERKYYVFLFLFMIVFYALHAIALLYTENMSAGYFELEEKLSFLVFPLIMLPIYAYRFEKKHLRTFFFTYLIAVLSASFFCLGQSTLNYLQTSDIQQFFYLNFSVIEHPTYFSMYVITAMILVIGVLIRQWTKLLLWKKILLFSLIPFFLLVVVLTNSRSAIIVAGIILMGSAFYPALRRRKFILSTLLFLLLFVSVFLAKKMMPHVFDRFYGIVEVLKADKMEDIKEWNGTTLRVQIYYSSFEVIKENFWIGVSPGDARDVLIQNYKKHGFRHAVERNYDAHNQFLQSFIGLGIAGFLIVFMIIGIPLFYAIRERDYILFFFTLMLFFLFLFESMLQKQAGVMFIVFGLIFLSSRERIFKD
jgi:O-antigen ligase